MTFRVIARYGGDSIEFLLESEDEITVMEDARERAVEIFRSSETPIKPLNIEVSAIGSWL